MSPVAVKPSSDPIPVPPVEGTLGYSVKEIEKHIHPVGGSKLYPTGVTPVTLTSGASSDLFGDWVEIIPASTVTNKFDPHMIYIANVSDVARYYVVEIGCGGAGSEEVLGRTVTGATSSSKGVVQFNLQMPRCDANIRLAARVKDDEAATNTIDVAIGYHEYPTVP